jgi:hypothetical protein
MHRRRIVEDMQLPPFTAKSVALYLIGVAALLLAGYFLVATLMNSAPHQRVPLQPSEQSVP